MRPLLIPAAAAALTLALAGGTAQADFQTPQVVGDTLTVVGDDGSDTLEIRRKPGDAAQVEVDAGDDGVVEGTFAIASFAKISIDAGGGEDVVRIDEAGNNTPIAPATIDGGAGDDQISGGPNSDVLTGGTGADIIDGDRGADVQQGQNGADLIVWDPGDGSDVVEGGAGQDVHRFNGAVASEIITIERSAVDDERIELLRNVGTIDMDVATTETIEVVGKAGEDVITAAPDLRPLTKLRLHGGDPDNPVEPSGDDQVTGSDSDDVLTGGDGTDTLSGGAGVDLVDGGEGADTLSCGGQLDDVVVSDGSDAVSADCLLDPPVQEPVDEPAPQQPKPEQPKPSVEQPKAEQRQAEQPGPISVTGRAAAFELPAFARYGFDTPKVSGSFRRLRVRLENLSGRTLALAVAAVDGRFVYPAVRRTVRAGETLDVVLRAPKALQRHVARRARRGARVRKPFVRVVNLETNDIVSVAARLRVAKAR